SQNIIAGTILVSSIIAAGVTATASADAANTAGAGAITLDPTTPVLDGAQSGVYRAVCIEPAANGGTFEVFDPKGRAIGKVAVG
ncbi:hypothetical protein KC221_27680, partial [Mycobacterium tuberculosis]|nr:hypothetical protein [Mycobacterium tuberculosis]